MSHFTTYKQLEYSDCGITCIRMIAKYYGKEIPLKILRSLCDASRIGVSLSDIINCTKNIGLDTTPIMVSIKDIYRMPLPAILHWEQNHYVVLYKTNKKRKKSMWLILHKERYLFKNKSFYTIGKVIIKEE